MDKKVARALRASRRQYQDGGFTSDTDQDQMRAASDPHRYERFVEPVAKGVQWLKEMVKAPFDMARDAREAGGYSNLDPTEVGRAGLNTGLGALAPAAGLATGALPKGSGFVLSSGGAPSEPKGIRAYHGSPHDFDRFDLSKIGTGEGAQAYGHGLYFAQDEKVARHYRDAMRDMSATPDSVMAAVPGLNPLQVSKLRKLVIDGASPDEVAKSMQLQFPSLAGDENAANIANAAKSLSGRLYEVRIDADPNDFLDWDAPLKDQRSIVDRVPMLREYADKQARHEAAGRPMSGGKLYAEGRHAIEHLRNRVRDEDRVSEMFREAGIPGIKYLDQGSRAAGDGSRNYVVFRDDIVNIVRKYGVAAAASMFGADAVTNAMQDAGTP